MSEALSRVNLAADTAVIDAIEETTGDIEPAEPVLPNFDPDGEVELSHVATHLMPLNGAQGLTLGGHFASGFRVSGLVRRMTMQRNGKIRVVIEIGSSNQYLKTGKFGVLYFSDWFYAEIDHRHYADINEGTELLK